VSSTISLNILVCAAAGGVGLILCQWAKQLGANIIGCVGSPEKAQLAGDDGCHHTILYRDEDIATRVREITEWVGVAVAYDSIGQATFESSLHSLRPFGVLATYGNAAARSNLSVRTSWRLRDRSTSRAPRLRRTSRHRHYYRKAPTDCFQ
jgi:NADPH:quinone reductase-like Zn-dependent oxidoreductase